MSALEPATVGHPVGHVPPLKTAVWGAGLVAPDSTTLTVGHGLQPSPVHGADATGRELVTNGDIGADLLRLPAGCTFPPHTHPGHHVLAIVGGEGTLTYGGEVHHTKAGDIYLVEGAVSHAVGAITDHVILAIGAPHKRIDSTDRMHVVPYEEVLAEVGDLTCLICARSAEVPARLHDVQCPHCPCSECAH